MAIYHCSSKIIKRSQGRSVISAAAYRACERLYDERQEQAFDYSSKKDFVNAEIFLPDGAPDWMKNREQVWNHLDSMERQWNGQMAREIQVALPVELTEEQNWELAKAFAQHFTEQGMIADAAFHRGHGNDQPHLHLLLSMRALAGDDFSKTKNRTWNSKSWLADVRVAWQDLANHHLAIHGHDVRIDHRSYEDQGVNLSPQNKIGVSATRAKRELSQGKPFTPSDRMDEYQRITEKNGKAIIADPTIALKLLSGQQSTFSDADIARIANRYSIDAEQFVRVYQSILQSPELLSLGRNDRNEMRYTSKEMLQIESDLVANVTSMANENRHEVPKYLAQKAIKSKTLSESQAEVLNALVHGGDAVAVVGFAGTGKTHLLGAAREVWEGAGYRVRGLALAGRAADGLLQDANIDSRTIASHLLAWKSDRERLDKKDVLVIDEAGMVDSRLLAEVIGFAKQAGAKVALVGDHTQLQPIGAGAAFRAILERIGFSSLTDIRRQKHDWMREASKDLALGRTQEALNAYHEHGFVHHYNTEDEALQGTVDSWWGKRVAHPNETATMSAFMRKHVARLNELGRRKMREAKKLGKDVTIKINDGKNEVNRSFAVGDEIYFLKNEKGLGVTGVDDTPHGVKNGTRGLIKKASAHQLTVEIIGGKKRAITFDVKDYNHFDYAYVATVHKLQGATFTYDDYFPSFNSNRYLTHVALTRHKEACDIHWSTEGFHHGYASLLQSMSREQVKDFTLDYRAPRSLERDVLIDVDGLLVNESQSKAVKTWINTINLSALANSQEPELADLVTAHNAFTAVSQHGAETSDHYKEKQADLVKAALVVKKAHQDYDLLKGQSPELIANFTEHTALATIEKGARQLSPAIPKPINTDLNTHLNDVLSSFDWAALERDKNKHPAIEQLVQAKTDYETLIKHRSLAVAQEQQMDELINTEKVSKSHSSHYAVLQRRQECEVTQQAEKVRQSIRTIINDEHLYREVTSLSATLIETLEEIKQHDFMKLTPQEQFKVIYDSIDWQSVENNKKDNEELQTLLKTKERLDGATQSDNPLLIKLRQEKLTGQLIDIEKTGEQNILNQLPSLEHSVKLAKQYVVIEVERSKSRNLGDAIGYGVDV